MLRLTITLMIALAAPQVSRAAEPSKPATQSKGKTVWASRMLHIPQAPEVEAFRRMVRAAAAENAKTLGVDAARAESLVEVVPQTADEGFGIQAPSVNRVTLVAKLFNDPSIDPRADEFLDGVVDTLRARLQQWLAETGGLAEAERSLREAEHELDKNRAQLRGHENDIRRATGRVDATLEQVRAAAPKLEEERQALKLTVVGKQARQDAITEAVARLSKAAEKRATEDPVAAELEKVVKAREVAFARIKDLYGAGQAAMSELVNAEVPISEARAKLLERRDTVAQTNGGELTAMLNRELAMVTIDVAEARAKLAALDEQLQRFDGVRDVLDRADGLRMIQARLLRSLDAADAALRDVTKRLPSRALRVVNSDSMAPGDPRLSQPPAAPPAEPGR